MTELSYNDWIKKLSGDKDNIINGCHRDLARLIKAMWAINREGKWTIWMNEDYIRVKFHALHSFYRFFYRDYDNSEIEALEAALQYIYEQEQGR